jgi:hypothetical protein
MMMLVPMANGRWSQLEGLVWKAQRCPTISQPA